MTINVEVDTPDEGFIDEQEFESLDELADWLHDLFDSYSSEQFNIEVTRDLQTGDSG